MQLVNSLIENFLQSQSHIHLTTGALWGKNYNLNKELCDDAVLTFEGDYLEAIAGFRIHCKVHNCIEIRLFFLVLHDRDGEVRASENVFFVFLWRKQSC